LLNYKQCDLTWRRRGWAGVGNNVSITTSARPLLCARVKRLVPVEMSTSHQVLPVVAVAEGFTDDVLVAVGRVLQPNLTVRVVAAGAHVYNETYSLKSCYGGSPLILVLHRCTINHNMHLIL